jgi:hypothetical protein
MKVDKIIVRVNSRIEEYTGSFFYNNVIKCPLCLKEYSRGYFTVHLRRRHHAILLDAKTERTTLEDFIRMGEAPPV